MTEASRVLVAVRVPADPGRTFSAFTDEIGTWWRPNGLFQFTDDRTGTLAFRPGPDGCLVETYDDGSTFTVGDVLAWEPPHRLVLTWRHASFASDQTTELHVTFTEVGAETRVVVEHFGWDRIPAAHAARHGFPLPDFQLRFAEWWREQLGRVAGLATR
ncbi:SRPBCC domain-containing protein [Aquihabitans daechungensis]|uniref:SRPBCC domain-containing protein n=1 Tax=Aquihabitans daechungensis TaxID=1052257 RepID=UPI003BA14F8C